MMNKILIYLLWALVFCVAVEGFCLPSQPDVYVNSNITCTDEEFSISGNLHINDTFNVTLINTSIYINTTSYYIQTILNGLLYLDQTSYIGPGPYIPQPAIQIVFDINQLKGREDLSYWLVYLTGIGFVLFLVIL